MTEPSKALLEYLRKVGLGLKPDFLREAIGVMSELLMELEVSQQIGAERYERSNQRTTQRNGYREGSVAKNAEAVVSSALFEQAEETSA